METTQNNMVDHDLLIELRTEMRAVRADIKDIKDGTTQRINALERDKEDKVEVSRVTKEIKETLGGFVTRSEFGLTQKIVYSASALILVAVFSAIIYQVVIH